MTTIRLSCLEPLRAGTEQPPVFMVVGGGGEVSDFAGVVEYIETKHPIYSLQARGADGAAAPFDRIEDMAETYLSAIHELQPHGPYVLVGYSMGGLVALEMAERLAQNKEEVRLLVMADTYPHQNFLTRKQQIRLLLQRFQYHVSTLQRLPLREAMNYIASRVRDRLRGARRSGQPGDLPSLAALPPDAVRQQMNDNDKLVWSRYLPPVYDGRVRYVRAGITTYFPKDASDTWSQFIRHLEVESIPVHHLGVIREPENLGVVLSRYLKEAFNTSSPD